MESENGFSSSLGASNGSVNLIGFINLRPAMEQNSYNVNATGEAVMGNSVNAARISSIFLRNRLQNGACISCLTIWREEGMDNRIDWFSRPKTNRPRRESQHDYRK